MKVYIQKAAVILASQSPRRKYLLEQAGLDFEIIPSSFDESSVPPTEPDTYAGTLSRAKADDIAARHPDRWVVGADTIVLINGVILGKPEDRSAAREMLQQLNGQTHQVYTGFTICCLNLNIRHTEVVCTDVSFKALSKDEIEWYIRTREPFDKAGAYAIQGLGTSLVKRINGSYTNVVGLPVCEVMDYFIQQGVLEVPPCAN